MEIWSGMKLGFISHSDPRQGSCCGSHPFLPFHFNKALGQGSESVPCYLKNRFFPSLLSVLAVTRSSHFHVFEQGKVHLAMRVWRRSVAISVGIYSFSQRQIHHGMSPKPPTATEVAE